MIVKVEFLDAADTKENAVEAGCCSEIPAATLVESHCPPPVSRHQCASTVMLTHHHSVTVCSSRAFL